MLCLAWFSIWLTYSQAGIGASNLKCIWNEFSQWCWKRGNFLRLCRIRISKMLLNILCRCPSKIFDKNSFQYFMQTSLQAKPNMKYIQTMEVWDGFPFEWRDGKVPQCDVWAGGQPQPTKFWWVGELMLQQVTQQKCLNFFGPVLVLVYIFDLFPMWMLRVWNIWTISHIHCIFE